MTKVEQTKELFNLWIHHKIVKSCCPEEVADWQLKECEADPKLNLEELSEFTEWAQGFSRAINRLESYISLRELQNIDLDKLYSIIN